MTYYELKYQLLENVLERDDSYNSNIMGKFFRRDLLETVDSDDDEE
jgi:hypothetical protein